MGRSSSLAASLASLLSLLLVACIASCGSSRPDGFDQAGAADAGPGGSSGGAEFPEGGAQPIGSGCTSDLRSAVDDQGHIVATCNPDQGCMAGKCVAACDAAGGSRGNVGCDFLVPTPSFYIADKPPCLAVFLANNWPHDAKITVTRGGVPYDVTTFARIPDATADVTKWPAVPKTGIPASKVAVLFMSDDPLSVNGASGANALSFACPVTPALSAAGGTAVYSQFSDSTGRGAAWHIATDIPVSAYDMLPYGGAKSVLPSAELVLPTTAWGKSYVAVTPRQSIGYGGVTSGPSWGQIVGSANGTTVKILPTTSLPAGPTVAAAPQNVTTTYTLEAGEFLQWQPSGDMTGSVIVADKPIAFVGGSAYLCLKSATSAGGGCDSAHQMIPPVAALAHKYVAMPYATRLASLAAESIPYRLVGTQDGTALTYDPAVPGAPTTLKQGEVADFEATTAFTVTSQDDGHPFYVGQYMSGSMVTGGSRPATTGPMCPGFLGDEEFVNMLPPAQWLSKYVFFTDPTYTTTNLVLVRQKTPTGFADVKVDCLGTVSGWQSVGTDGNFEITNVDLVRGTPVGTCTNGGHSASSEGAFGLTVWGLDACSSYAYPAGGNVGVINTVSVSTNPR